MSLKYNYMIYMNPHLNQDPILKNNVKNLLTCKYGR